MRKKLMKGLLGVALGIVFCSSGYANNVAVHNVELLYPNPQAGTVTIRFNLTQENTFGNHIPGVNKEWGDVIWVFVKYSLHEGVGGSWYSATLAPGGSLKPTNDGRGAFAKVGTHTVIWNFKADNVNPSAKARVRVMAIEMVYIPEGPFWYNVGGIGGLADNNFGGGEERLVSSEDDLPTGIPEWQKWPNGYRAFYVMKYEVSQQQYVDFLNSLPASKMTTYSQYVTKQQGLEYNADAPLGKKFSTTAPDRAFGYFHWSYAKAYAEWAGLRPMTEMEYEKVARGSKTTYYFNQPEENKRIYPWGNREPGEETYSDGKNYRKYYANYGLGSEGQALDVGHYLRGDVSRTADETGASIYGVVDLAGNLREQVINCNWKTVPLNGSSTTWPVNTGIAVRGGSYQDGESSLRISDRAYSSYYYNMGHYPYYAYVGFRAARTPDKE